MRTWKPYIGVLVVAIVSLALPACLVSGSGARTLVSRGNAEGFSGIISALRLGGRAVTMQSGKLVFAIASENLVGKVSLVRLHPNFTLDTEFGDHGRTQTPLYSGGSAGNSVVALPDGSLLVTGTLTKDDKRGKMAIAKYDLEGNLEGILYSPFPRNHSRGTALAIQSDGKFLVAGSAVQNGVLEFALVRYASFGQLDTEFGTSGIVTTNVSMVRGIATAIAIQKDGKILVGGRADMGPERNEDFALVRYHRNGILDDSFGKGGIAVTEVSSDHDCVAELVLQRDGKIIAVGRKGKEHGSDQWQRSFLLARYDSNGTLDASFGTGGIVTTVVGGRLSRAKAALVDDGKILAVGNAHDSEGKKHFALARYHADGRLDAGFGDNGTVMTSLSSADDSAYAVILEPDGRIAAAGTTNVVDPSSPTEFGLARYEPDGRHFETLIVK